VIYLLDISRLVENLHLETPTGIDRVEMAYAQHFLNRDGDVRFVLTWPTFTGLLSREEARPLIEGAAQRWSIERKTEQESFEKLRDLVQATILPHRAPRVASFGAPDDKRSPVARIALAKLWLKSRFDGISAARLAEFSQSGAWYIHVSQFRLNRSRRFAWLSEAKIRSLFMLHDLIPILYPEYCRPGESRRHAARVATMVERASLIVANSEATRRSLESHLTGRSLPPCEVVPLGISPGFTTTADVPPIQSAIPYFVVIGTIEPRKNLEFLLTLWRRLTHDGQSARALIVIVGRRGWEVENVSNLLDRSVGLAPTVAEVRSLSDTSLVALLRGATAMVAPSFVEGYGLPVAEALALGVPVLASDIPAHREVGGEYAEYIHPLDGRGWAEALDDYAAPNSKLRQAQLQKLKHYSAPTWTTHMARIEKLIE
jgi:glycosyltransferase involved in cell wall biosynthesis